jgi:hypothetical protein
MPASETNVEDASPLLPLPRTADKGWDGKELTPAEYVHSLSPIDICSVQSAIKHFEGKLRGELASPSMRF